MSTTRPDLVNLPQLTNPTDSQTKFVVQDSGVNQTLTADQTRQFLGDMIGPTGPQGPQGVSGPQGPQGVQGPQGPAFVAYSTSTVAPQNTGSVLLTVTTSNHSFVNGNRVIAISEPMNFFEGFVYITGGTNFNIVADYSKGNITSSSWTITLTGQLGATGPQGPQGVQGPQGPSFRVTSNTPATPASSGNITLNANTSNHAFIVGQRVIAVNASNNYFEGTLQSLGLDNQTFLIAADYNFGSATTSSWTIGLSGQRGPAGPQGPQGITGPTGPMVYAKKTGGVSVTPDGTSLTTLVLDNQYSNHLFVKGLRVAVLNTDGNFFEGTITNNVVNTTTFIIQQDRYSGGVAATDWTVVLAGRVGPQGPAGPSSTNAIESVNVGGGTTGTILIQSATSTTSFITPGSNGNLLRYQSNTASWVSTSSLRIGSADRSDQVYAQTFGTAELSPSKYIGIISNASAYTGIGVQTGLEYDTNQEKLIVSSVVLTSNSSTFNTTTGALQVAGGVGIGEDVYIGGSQTLIGILQIDNTASAISTSTGALRVKGGVGIGGDLYIGGEIIANKLTIELTTVTTTQVTTDDIIKTSNNTNAISTVTGALQIAGGAGIGRDLRVGGDLYATNIIGNIVSTIQTASNIAAGSAGQIPYQTGVGQTGFIPVGTTGTVLVAKGAASPVWQNTLTLAGTDNAVSSSTGALQVAGGASIGKDLYVGGTIYGTVTTASYAYFAGTATLAYLANTATLAYFANTATFAYNATTATFAFTATTATFAQFVLQAVTTASNISGGGPGQIVYQISTSTTGFVPAGTNGYILATDGTTPYWTASNAVLAGQVNTVATATNASHFLTFVNSNNSTATPENLYTTSSFVVNPANGFVGLNVASPTTLLDIGGGVKVSGITTVTNITSATSTQSGALQVAGGLGLGGSLYLNGYLQVGFASTTSYSTGTNGEIRATNEITAYYSSDKNLKENLKLIADPITIVNQINGYFFDWKDEYINRRGGEDGFFVRKADIGVIAQEIEEVLPEIVATRDDGTKAVKYEKIVPLLIEAIKFLHKEVEILKKKIP
jgi:hypothetical protein